MELVWDNVSCFYGNHKVAQPRFVRIVEEPGVGRAANTLSWLSRTQFRLGDRDVAGRPGVREVCLSLVSAETSRRPSDRRNKLKRR